ncbi:MAG: YncE family protein [Acidobacteriaceae bacterium]|nr:YncE family protein [Acidobacteriaceae bacterium]
MNRRRFIQSALVISTFAVALVGQGGVFAQASSQFAQDTSSTAPTYTVLNNITIGGVGEWGYLTLDSAARRLYLPRTNDVQVMDLDSNTLVGTMANVSTQVNHGVAIAPDQNLGFATAGKDNNVAVFDPATLTVTARIPVDGNPNAIIYDPASKHVLVNTHTDDATIDPANLTATPVDIPMGVGLEYATVDGRGNAFVAIESSNEIVRIDMNTNQITARWPVVPGATPSGITYDATHNRVLVSCHSGTTDQYANGTLVVLDADSGNVISATPIGQGASGLAYDPVHDVVMTANGGDGTTSVVKETSPGEYQVIQTLNTILGARHVVFDAKTNLFYLEGDLAGNNSYAQGESFGVLVVGPENSN